MIKHVHEQMFVTRSLASHDADSNTHITAPATQFVHVGTHSYGKGVFPKVIVLTSRSTAFRTSQRFICIKLMLTVRNTVDLLSR